MKPTSTSRKCPSVSVMMTVYNSELYLKEAIDSILAQTYADLELIIVNDGSTDNSAKIIQNYTDPRIRYVENDGNKGILYSRNRLLELAEGEFLAVMDSDDVALPNRLQIQIDFLQKHPEVGICGTWFRVINTHGQKRYSVKFPTSDKAIRSYLHFGNCFCHSTVVMRRELALKVGYPAEYSLGEDYALWKAALPFTQMANIPVFTTYYRTHNSNVSNARHEEMFRSVRQLNETNLTKLAFPHTESDLDLYSNFLIYNAKAFEPTEKFREMENLLVRLYTHCKKNPEIDKSVLSHYLLQRYIVTSYKTRRFHLNTFFKLYAF